MATNYPASLDNDVSLLLAKDLAVSTLANAITADATSLPLASTLAFAGTGGVIKIDHELIKYTGLSGNNLTGAIRGYSSTSAVAHSSGAEVRLVVAADYHNNLKDAVIALETRLGANGQMAVIDGVQLRAGVQEEGRASHQFRSAVAGEWAEVGIGFRAMMTNTPSSITLSNVGGETAEVNLDPSSPQALTITKFGFRFALIALNANTATYSLSKKYLTVGN